MVTLQLGSQTNSLQWQPWPRPVSLRCQVYHQLLVGWGTQGSPCARKEEDTLGSPKLGAPQQPHDLLSSCSSQGPTLLRICWKPRLDQPHWLPRPSSQELDLKGYSTARPLSLLPGHSQGIQPSNSPTPASGDQEKIASLVPCTWT